MPAYTQDDCDEIDVAIAENEAIIAELWTEVESIDEIITEIEEEIQDVEDEQKTLRDEYVEKKMPQEELQRELDTSNDRLDELESEIPEKQTECEGLEEEFDAAMVALADAEADLGVKETELREATDSYYDLTDRVHALSDDADETEFDEAVNELESWIEHMVEIETEVETLTTERDADEDVFDKAESDVEACKEELEDLLQEQATLEGRVPEIEDELEDIGDIESIVEEDTALWRIINEKNGEKTEWEASKGPFMEEIELLQSEIDTLDEEWDAHCPPL